MSAAARYALAVAAAAQHIDRCPVCRPGSHGCRDGRRLALERDRAWHDRILALSDRGGR